MSILAIRPSPEAAVDDDVLARFFRVLGDPTRLAILGMLAERSRNVSEICGRLGIAQSNVSNHLACLRWCELVQATRIGREQIYELVDADLPALVERVASNIPPDLAARLKSCRRLGP